LELLFPNGSEGEDELPRVKDVKTQADTLRALGAAYRFKGDQQRGIRLIQRSIRLSRQHEDSVSLISGMEELTHSLRAVGSLQASVVTGCKAYLIARRYDQSLREARVLRALGITLSSVGRLFAAGRILDQARQEFDEMEEGHWVGATLNQIAQCVLWAGDPAACVNMAKEARALIDIARCEHCLMVTQRVEGLAMLELGDFNAADKRLLTVLHVANKVLLREQEFHALVGLAKLRVHEGEYEAARDFLDALWDAVEDGPCQLIHSDACNVLAWIERNMGDHAKAVEAATRAYRLAWCDGPPFAYHWGLTAARRHLEELGAPEPEMPSFDASRFEPIPSIGIDLNDELHGNDADL
jgi:tetratricopeptide (TPR) repeat protein